MMQPSSGRLAVVTGAGGALGFHIVAHFLGTGRTVLAIDRDTRALSSLAGHERLNVVTADLCDPASLDEALAIIPKSEPIGLLVNAVGFILNDPVLAIRGAKLRRHSIEAWRQVLDANLTAPFVACVAIAERMARTGGGCIINFSSVTAKGNPGQAAYSAAKAGVEGLTRALAQELGAYGIRVNAISPGFIDVQSTREALSSDQIAAKTAQSPLNRLGRAEEIAVAIDAIEANAFMTGVVLPVDGGVRI